MSDKVENLKLLIKFLGMTRSANSGEALVAIRKANEHLDKTGATWEELLNGKIKITIVEDPFKNLKEPPSQPVPKERFASGYAPQRPAPPPPKATYYATVFLSPIAMDHARRGNIIEALKNVRLDHPGIGLKEAKDAVDAWIAANVTNKSTHRFDPRYDPFNPVQTPSSATQQKQKTNAYPGVCHKCGTRVGSGEGFLAGKTASGQYRIECAPGKCVTSKYAKKGIDLSDLAAMGKN